MAIWQFGNYVCVLKKLFGLVRYGTVRQVRRTEEEYVCSRYGHFGRTATPYLNCFNDGVLPITHVLR